MRAKISILIVAAIIAISTLPAASSATAQQTALPARDASTHTAALIRASGKAGGTTQTAARANLAAAWSPRASSNAATPNQNPAPDPAPGPANDPRFKA